jgi:hypothetical protein
MPRKLRLPKMRRALLAASGARRLAQLTDLKLGPQLPAYRDTNEPIYTSEEDIAAHYVGGFRSYDEMKQAWGVHSEELMAQDPGSWWAWQQWSEVKVSDLVGGDE